MSTTPNLGLIKPDIGNTNWGSNVNDNWDKLDGNLAVSPISFNMLTRAPDSVGQGTWTRVQSANLYYNAYFYNSTGADGDVFAVVVRVPAGTYTLRVASWRGFNIGIAKIYFDDVLKGTFDLYAATGSNYELEIAGLDLNGEHTIKVKVDGKNGSASGYYSLVNEFELIRTGD